MGVVRCFCDHIPTISLATRVIVIAYKREILAPSNTGRLATLALSNSVLLARGDQNQPYRLTEHLLPGCPSLVLFPSEEAEPLSEALLDHMTRPFNLVVPDGNWRQTAKMIRRDSDMAQIPRVTLPLGNPSDYRIRTERKPEGLATIEAIARALGIIEGSEVQVALEDLLEVKVSRTLASRGVVKEWMTADSAE